MLVNAWPSRYGANRMVPVSGGLAAGEHFDQRRLANAVGAQRYRCGRRACTRIEKPSTILPHPIGPADVFGLDDELAGLFSLRGGEVGIAGRAAIVRAAAGAARGDCRAA